jgi:replicative DNA helicase
MKNAYASDPIAAGLPQADDAERSILGSIMLENALLEEASTLSLEDFFLQAHRYIFSQMRELASANRAVDIVTLRDSLNNNRQLDASGGVSYLASLTENMPRHLSIAEYVSIVREKAACREMVAMAEWLKAAAYEAGGSYEVAEKLRERVSDLQARSYSIWNRKSSRKLFAGGMDFLRESQPEVDWAVEGLIQRGGNGLIVGDPGSAKSLLALDLALHLATGTSWLGRRVTKRMKVGIVSREDHASLSQSRGMQLIAGAEHELQNALDELDLNTALYFNTRAQSETFLLDREQDVLDVIDELKEAGVEIVIFDVFRRLWEGDENDNQAVAKVLANLTRIQSECNCSVVLIHHLGKAAGGTIFQRMRGASAIYGWREWAMGITVENPGDSPEQRIRKIEFETKADVASVPLYFQIAGNSQKTQLCEVEAPDRPARLRGVREVKAAPGYQQTSYFDRG